MTVANVLAKAKDPVIRSMANRALREIETSQCKEELRRFAERMKRDKWFAVNHQNDSRISRIH